MSRLIPFLVFVLLLPYLRADGVSDQRTALVPKERAKAFVELVCEHQLRGITDYWTPTIQDARGLEDGLLAYLAVARPEAAAYFSAQDGEKLKAGWHWFRRHVAGIVVAGERLLLVSYQCEDPRETRTKESEVKAKMQRMGRLYDPDGWKERWAGVTHGGYLYFRVVFSPRKHRFIWYEENAPAGVIEFPEQTLVP